MRGVWGAFCGGPPSRWQLPCLCLWVTQEARGSTHAAQRPEGTKGCEREAELRVRCVCVCGAVCACASESATRTWAFVTWIYMAMRLWRHGKCRLRGCAEGVISWMHVDQGDAWSLMSDVRRAPACTRCCYGIGRSAALHICAHGARAFSACAVFHKALRAAAAGWHSLPGVLPIASQSSRGIFSLGHCRAL